MLVSYGNGQDQVQKPITTRGEQLVELMKYGDF